MSLGSAHGVFKEQVAGAVGPFVWTWECTGPVEYRVSNGEGVTRVVFHHAQVG